MNALNHPRIGLALDSGSARGWAHMGVIRALEQAGIRPDIVCGTSIGALVGAVHAAGELERLEEWVRTLRFKNVLSFMDVSLAGGLLKGERLMDFFRNHFQDRPIEALQKPFAAVATELHTGAEVWLRDGPIFNAVRASIALPALFTPVPHSGKVLVDGGLVNPVPVSLARAMGADFVIAVDLNTDLLGKSSLAAAADSENRDEDNEGLMRKLYDSLGRLGSAETTGKQEKLALPSMLDVLASSVNIMQVRIGRSRMAGDPPDLVIAPRLAHLGLLDFHRAEEAIEEGIRAVERIAHNLPAS